MNGKAIALAVLLLAVGLPASYYAARRSPAPPYSQTCVAGPGTVNPNDICGDEEFYQDTLRLVKLDKLVAEGKAKAAVTGEHPLWLQEKQDQLRGMNERLSERLPRDPKAANPANPQGITHVWDFHVNRLVPFQPVPPFDASKAPAPAQPTPSAKPADAKKP